jgi:GntR family transcriptional regulator/MocR family aminotransferase
MPDLRLFPHNEFRAFLAESYKRTPVKILGYGDAAGHPPFVQAVKTYIRRARAISGREIIVTHGSQEGIYLTAQLLIKPGDYVAVERLGYRPAWEALRAAGATLVPVNIDQDGIDPDALEKILQRKKIRLLYVTPLHQYPTTVTLAIPRRMRLYELAARYGVPILEDDYDHEFHYRSQPLAPLASRDPAEQIIYVSTFSKNLYPSARLGFIAAPAAIAEKLKAAKQVISRQNDLLLQDAVAQWIQDGGFEKHLRRMRRVYEQRRETMLECIRRGIERGLPFSCNEPDGGMAVWLRVKTCTDNLMQQLAVRGVKVTSESAYSLKPGKAEHLRLGFANQRPEEIQAGMDILFKMLS